MKMLLLTVDDKVQIVDLRNDWRDLSSAVDSTMADRVAIQNQDVFQAKPDLKKYVMLIDGESLLKRNNVCNPLASILYNTHEHGHPVMGNVLLARANSTEHFRELVKEKEETLADLQKFLSERIELLASGGVIDDLHGTYDGVHLD